MTLATRDATLDLLDGEVTAVEVALAAGFGNQSHLTTHFRREIGTTPARFRALA